MARAKAPAGRSAALVTGGSTGIGLAIAREFAAHGHDLFLVARDPARLETAAAEIAGAHSVRVRTLAIDVTSPGACAEIESALGSSGLELGYLINNAAAWHRGYLQEAQPQELERLLAVNVVALHALTQALLPQLLARGRGAILNVGSLGGMVPMPSLALYSASKTFVHAMTAALRQELRGSGVSVSLLAPGMVRTAFVTRETSAPLPAWIDLIRSSPETVARAAYLGVMAGSAVIVPGLIWRIAWFGTRVLPARIITGVLAATFRYLRPTQVSRAAIHDGRTRHGRV